MTDKAIGRASWPEVRQPPDGVPNVLVVVLDDVGFAHLGCYGSSIETPNIDRLAQRGLRYSNFHTTALCSPSRASLLTGRNHHSVGIGMVCGFANGHPGYVGAIPKDSATVAELLSEEGYATIAIGKWHLAPLSQLSAAGPQDSWPLNRGFDQFYGFLGASTDQFTPQLVAGNESIDVPDDPDYHVSEDLASQAIARIGQQRAIEPNRPWFTYFAFGAIHAPLQAPRDFINKYRGRFDHGWDEERKRVFARQQELGIIPDHAELVDRNDDVRPWDELSDTERTVYARMQEVVAGFLDHTDAQIGRLLDGLEEMGELDDTLVVLVSDNGASQEGGPTGRSELLFLNDLQFEVEDMLPYLDELGGPEHHSHYPTGWAQVGNTPLKRYKRNTFGGGIRDPLIVSWPSVIADTGSIRHQYHHVGDITPTVLELLGLEPPTSLGGVDLQPLEGTSLAYSLDDADAPTRKKRQYYEMWGDRAIWEDGWKAVTAHDRGASFADDQWQLYHVDTDFSEANDLSSEHPERLASLIDTWWNEAERFQVLPLDDRSAGRARQEIFQRQRGYPNQLRIHGRPQIHCLMAPGAPGVPKAITASIGRDDESVDGVLVSLGGRFGGYSLYIKDNHLVFEYAYYLLGRWSLRSADPLPTGAITCGVVLEPAGDDGVVQATLVVNEEVITEPLSIQTVSLWHLEIEPFEIGQDSISPVSPAYESPFSFGGTIDHVDVEVPAGWPDDKITDAQLDAVIRWD